MAFLQELFRSNIAGQRVITHGLRPDFVVRKAAVIAAALPCCGRRGDKAPTRH